MKLHQLSEKLYCFHCVLLLLSAPLWAASWQVPSPQDTARRHMAETMGELREAPSPSAESDYPIEVTVSHQGPSILKAPEFAGETMPAGRGIHELVICNNSAARLSVEPMRINAALVENGIATSSRELAQVAVGRTRLKRVSWWSKALAPVGQIGLPTAAGLGLSGAIEANPYLAGGVSLAMYLVPKLAKSAGEELQATKRSLNAIEGVTWLTDLPTISLAPGGCVGKIVVFGSFDLSKPTRTIFVRNIGGS